VSLRAKGWLTICLCAAVGACGGPSAAAGKVALARSNVAQELMTAACENFADAFLITQAPPPPPPTWAQKISKMDSAVTNAAAAAKDDFIMWAIGSQAIARLDEALHKRDSREISLEIGVASRTCGPLVLAT